MSKIERFEDLNVWKISRKLSKLVYEATNKSSFNKDFALKDQIRRSAISISSNIAEGFERGGNKEFIQFLFYAKASSAELRSQLYLAFDCEYISDSELQEMKGQAEIINRMIQGLVDYLKSSEIKGIKFKEAETQYILHNSNIDIDKSLFGDN